MEGGEPQRDPAEVLKEVEKEKQRLLMLSMEKEKKMREREEKLKAEKRDLELLSGNLQKELDKLKQDVNAYLRVKGLFLLQASILEAVLREEPDAVRNACQQLGIPEEKLLKLREFISMIRDGR